MRTPLVSVVIPTYNRAGLVCRAIDNVFQQTYTNFELIIVDDGSKDETLLKLRAYGTRIRVIAQENVGPAVARNRGAAAARGEIIAFQDSDDLWEPTKLERQLAALERAGKSVPCCLSNVLIGVYHGKTVTSFDDSLLYPLHEEGIWLNVAEVLATRFVLFNQAAAIRKEAFEKAGGFDAQLKYLEDYDLPLRLALQGPWALIRTPLVIYGENSPESFHEQALKDAIVLKECQLKIIERILTNVADTRPSLAVQRLLQRRLKLARRQLTAMKLSHTTSFFGKQILGRLLLNVDRCRMAAFRRSPWFPKPITLPIDGAGLT